MSIQQNNSRTGQTPTEQDLLNFSFDAEIDVLAHEIVGSPEAIGSGTRHMYGVKVFSNGGLAVVNPDGTNVFSGGTFTAAPTFAKNPGAATPTPAYGLVDANFKTVIGPSSQIGTAPAVPQTGQVVSNTTRVQLSASSIPSTNGILIQALSTNAASVFIGSSTVTVSGTTGGFELQPGQAVPFTAGDLNLMYVIGANNTDGVCWNVL